MITDAIIVATLVLCAASLGFVVWSILDTRKKYYDEYMSRKKK